MVSYTGVLRHTAKTEQGWLSQIYHQPGETTKKRWLGFLSHTGAATRARVKRLRSEPDHSIEESLVLAVLREDGQEVTLQDLCGSQLLPHVSGLILVPQVSDQILHTLFRGEDKRLTQNPEGVPGPMLFVPTARGIHQTSVW